MSRGTPLKIFVASGSELIDERRETIQVVHELRKVFPSLNLEAVEWETDIPPGSYDKQRIQDKINSLVKQCEVVLVLFYSKIGTFTLEEYQLAIVKNKKVFLYFKTGFSPKNKRENDNYGKVLEFREEIESENRLQFKEYQTLKDFKAALKEDLTLYLSQTYIQAAPEEPGSGEGMESLQVRLYRGSKKYYDALRGPNGRFKFLGISDIILPGTGDEWLETCAAIDELNKKLLRGGQGGGFLEKSPPGRRRQNNLTVLEVLPLLWALEIKHAVLVGDGGMGKTVSLIHWWKKLLETGECRQGEPIPVFITLNEFNQVPSGKREDFIIASILKNYGGDDRESLTAAELKRTMETPLTVGCKIIPSIVLLLDGFNEITVEKKELLLELNHLVEQCLGIQVVITSRYDMRGNFNWCHWNLVQLQELEGGKVAEYLQGKDLEVPGPGRLWGLLGNPMMLTLYAASCEVQAYQKNSRYCCFKEIVETPGELFWNFIEAQVAKIQERVGPDEGHVVYYWFLLKYLLPGLGYEMEKQGLFDFTNTQFQEGLDRLCRRFAQDDFLDTFPQFGKYEDMLPLRECADVLERRKRTGWVRDIFCNELHVLVEEGQALRFLHQDFRDFFASVHLLNEAEISLSKGEIPGVFKERLLDYFVRRLVGEIQGEHRIKPYLEENTGWSINIDKENRLHRIVDLCRGKFGEDVGLVVCNIVTIWKEVRGELSGADLSNLDLSDVTLNGVLSSRFYEDRYLAAVFDGSRVHEKNLLPQGHSTIVSRAVYSPDGKGILSASYDKTIKEWDRGTGKCVKTLTDHTSGVLSAVYSPDGKYILSASYDKTIKEWDRGTGKCVKTLIGHKDYVRRAVYSKDGKKILSASDDHTIKEWDVGNGECIKTLIGHTHWVTSAVYSTDGKRIFSDSFDGTIKEWNAATGKCLKTHQKKDHSQIPGYLKPKHKNIKLKSELKLRIKENKIFILDASGQSKEMELINIPGLFIQGCSFQNLEKGSEWTEEGLAILKQYNARVSVDR